MSSSENKRPRIPEDPEPLVSPGVGSSFVRPSAKFSKASMIDPNDASPPPKFAAEPVLADDTFGAKSAATENSNDAQNRLLNHWLFVDDNVQPSIGPSATSFVKPSNPFTSPVVTSSSTFVKSGFKFASGRDCEALDADLLAKCKTLVNGIDSPRQGDYPNSRDDVTAADDDDDDKPPISDFPKVQGKPLRHVGFSKASSFASVSASSSRDENFKTLEQGWVLFSRAVPTSEINGGNCEKGDKPKQSIETLAKLWSLYGNPVATRASSALDLCLVKFPTDSDDGDNNEGCVRAASVGDLKHLFTAIVKRKVSRATELETFGLSWFKVKYQLYASIECRIYTSKLVAMVKGGVEIPTALEQQPLPDPLRVLKRILRCFWEEYKQKSDPTLLTIVQGDAPPESPVVVQVEDIKDNVLYLSDGKHLFNGICDAHLVNLVAKGRIKIGTKICLHGILVSRVLGDVIDLELVFNATSLACGKRLGIQNKHSNAHISGLIGGAGFAAMVDFVVLMVFPLEYRLYLKNQNLLILTESELARLRDIEDNREAFEGIESVYCTSTLLVIDSKCILDLQRLGKDSKDNFNHLYSSCAFLALKNVNEDMLTALQVGNRLVMSLLKVQAGGNVKLYDSGSSPKRVLRLLSSVASRMRLMPCPDVAKRVASVWDKSEQVPTPISTLILNNPILCLGKDEAPEWPSALPYIVDQAEEPYVGLAYNCHVVVLHVGEVTATRFGRCFRCFVATSKMCLASILVTARSAMFPDGNGKLADWSCSLDFAHKSLSQLEFVTCDKINQQGQAVENVFMQLENLQYEGFYEAAQVYNFHVVSRRLRIRPIQVVAELDEIVSEQKLITKGKNRAMAVENMEQDNIYNKFAKAAIQLKIKALALLNANEPACAQFAATLDSAVAAEVEE